MTVHLEALKKYYRFEGTTADVAVVVSIPSIEDSSCVTFPAGSLGTSLVSAEQMIASLILGMRELISPGFDTRIVCSACSYEEETERTFVTEISSFPDNKTEVSTDNPTLLWDGVDSVSTVVDILSWLLYLFDAKELLVSGGVVDIRLSQDKDKDKQELIWRVCPRVAQFHPSCHASATLIKAVTFHNAEFNPVTRFSRIIFDI